MSKKVDFFEMSKKVDFLDLLQSVEKFVLVS